MDPLCSTTPYNEYNTLVWPASNVGRFWDRFEQNGAKSSRVMPNRHYCGPRDSLEMGDCQLSHYLIKRRSVNTTMLHGAPPARSTFQEGDLGVKLTIPVEGR
nr:unnamed protein product [Callosobruchus chinensis]